MKKVALWAALVLPIFGLAQTTQGVVTYGETIKINFQGPDNAPPPMGFPTSQDVQWALAFTPAASLFRSIDPGETTNETESDGATVRMVMMRPDNQFYKDLENETKVESREFMGRKFLIKGDLPTLDWKLTGEQKKILDYVCQKAVLQDTSRNVVAWFTPQLPVPTGPNDYGQLPGLILELNVDEGQRVMVAQKVELRAPGKEELEIPTKGKDVTEEEFNRIRDEKLKEMGAQPGGRGGMRVIIRNN